jgi:hypothetical protein
MTAKKIKAAQETSSFLRFLEETSKEVSSWPEWMKEGVGPYREVSAVPSRGRDLDSSRGRDFEKKTRR